MIRAEIYEALRGRLLATGKVRHVALWNEQVAFADQEEAWERPAVFVEFGQMRWDRTKEPGLYLSTDAELRLHVVTDWTDGGVAGDGNLAAWLATDAAVGACTTQGDGWAVTGLLETATNHNHEELLESVEVMRLRLARRV